jgi:hypothetical protein
MGIGAMIGGMALGAVGNVISGIGQKNAANKQARAMTAAGQQSAETQRMMYEQGQQAVQPYAQAGQQALGQFQGLLTPQGQADFTQQYTQSPQFQMMQQQAEEATLRNASATGGLRTGQSKVALSSIAPQLINQAYGQQMQGLQGLYQQGAGLAGQSAGLAANVGQNIAGTQYGAAQGAANAQYQGNTAMTNMLGNTLGQIGGMGLNYGINQMYAPTQVSTRPGQTYGR